MISLYFHLPFCRRKCPYCHFFVIPEREQDKELLHDALIRHIDQIKPRITGQKIPSIYFGGGTPSLFGPSRIQKLLDQIEFDSSCEITLEANPEDITTELMTAYKDAGVNRVSIGVQTLDDQLLKVLGRTHSADKAIHAVHTVSNTGIKNISIDLMYELPHQTLASFKETVEKASALPITHLSLYNLTFEPQTSFYKHQNRLQKLLPTSEESLAMLEYAVASLESCGLKRYEISAFAKEGHISQHNTGYWTARPFIGLGPSAFSYIEGKRCRNISHLRRYAESLSVDFEEKLPFPDNLKELLAVELRLLSGVNLKAFEARHAPLPLETRVTLQELIKEGFLLQEDAQMKLSAQGLLFYDTVATRII